MNYENPNPRPRRNLFVSAWRGLDWTRRFVLNVLFLILLLIVVRALFSSSPELEIDGAALVIQPAGFLSEELYGDARERALMHLAGEGPDPETLMRPLLGAIEAATDDDRIEVIYLDLTRLLGGGLTKLEQIGRALEGFRAAGKKVIATADAYTQAPYYLASFADEVYLHEMGIVFLQGFGSYRNYYRDAIDKLEIDWNIFRVGEYKSAVEPYLRNDMSDEARAARLEWLSDLWNSYVSDVSSARDLEPAALEEYVQQFDQGLARAEGDPALMALEAGLVDKVVQRDEVRERMVQLVGESDSGESFRQVDHEDYWSTVSTASGRGEEVAVVVATGTILDGTQPPGTIGGDSTARLLRDAREDDNVAAVVLRVDSPGGSVFASEVIRREVELTRDAGKPVIASMGTVAASGGYWISMPADEIWASPTTITGSIGVFAMFPTFERTLRKVGVTTDGVGTTPWSDVLRPDRSLSDEAASIFQLGVEKNYRQFIEEVAKSRDKPVEEIDAVARGRVWSGVAAERLGLVDELGDLEDAISAAAEHADLGDDYAVRYITQPVSAFDTWLETFTAATASRFGPLVAGRFDLRSFGRGSVLRNFQGIERDLAEIGRWNDPFGNYAYCFCGVD